MVFFYDFSETTLEMKIESGFNVTAFLIAVHFHSPINSFLFLRTKYCKLEGGFSRQNLSTTRDAARIWLYRIVRPAFDWEILSLFFWHAPLSNSCNSGSLQRDDTHINSSATQLALPTNLQHHWTTRDVAMNFLILVKCFRKLQNSCVAFPGVTRQRRILQNDPFKIFFTQTENILDPIQTAGHLTQGVGNAGLQLGTSHIHHRKKAKRLTNTRYICS